MADGKRNTFLSNMQVVFSLREVNTISSDMLKEQRQVC